MRTYQQSVERQLAWQTTFAAAPPRSRPQPNDGFVGRGAPAARCRRPELGRFVAGGPTWPNGETVLAGLRVVLLAMGLAESTRHAGLGALPAAASRKPRLAGRPGPRIVLAPMHLAMAGVDPGLAAQEAEVSDPPPFPQGALHGRHRSHMARAVGGVGRDPAPDAPAHADTVHAWPEPCADCQRA